MCWGLNGSRTRLPVKFLTEFSCRPGSRYSPLPLAKLVQRCAFLVLTQAKQFACSGQIKTPAMCWGLNGSP